MLSSNLPSKAKGRFAPLILKFFPRIHSKPQRPFPETSSKCILNSDDMTLGSEQSLLKQGTLKGQGWGRPSSRTKSPLQPCHTNIEDPRTPGLKGTFQGARPQLPPDSESCPPPPKGAHWSRSSMRAGQGLLLTSALPTGAQYVLNTLVPLVNFPDSFSFCCLPSCAL